MKQLVILIIVLLTASDCNAQTNLPYVNEGKIDTTAINDVKEIKKAREIIKKQCIKFDTAISQMKCIKETQEDIIAKLRERKAQRTNRETD